MNRNDEVLSALFLLHTDFSVIVGCDAVPNASKGRVASVFRVKQCC